ncbi:MULTISPECIES: NUDIX hydrolase [Sinorhizobium]|uniref:Nicotinic acid mononucleotide biosynthesis protein n=2 Tax=Sinorhizobium TaxID=28105 RepID=A0A2L0H2S9_RHIFR|nr:MULTISPECIES: NAD regulator [Sinorhizobium]ASY55784.1 putative NAD regulator in Alphaproteobacteria [Sinorhizobium sp. CCBAU 05631]AUX75737.1 nicotinic acid mononucleotide biosynthesis protein [Sinorhizobium fredii]
MRAEGVPDTVEIGLNAVIVAVVHRSPRILAVSETDGDARDSLPFGPFDPARHRTFEASLRDRVEKRTALKLGYIEQLYTFGDRGRQRLPGEEGKHMVSVGYLALTRTDAENNERLAEAGAHWRDWYGYLPWEDWRQGRPQLLDQTILPALARWEAGPDGDERSAAAAQRRSRVRLAFGLDDFPWDEERVLERYELLYEAGLVREAEIDGHCRGSEKPAAGLAMQHDHRRIVATAVARLRGKIKYRPVVFELMPPEFTLTDLQATVEAISGRHLHKQNFRRLVEGAELVEPTGGTLASTGGRPAALFRFRRQILDERPAPGLKVGGR